jgi:hypothetical protein
MKPELCGLKTGDNIVPIKFTGARYYFNMLGVAKLFAQKMPSSLKSVTVFYVGGAVVTV